MPGVYISWPFCAQKCTYCNFASGVQPKELEERYLTALLAEAGGFEWLWRPETVYLGGGTPSAMASADLAKVLSAIPGRPWREATIEAAPGSLRETDLEEWQRAGIDRVSLGVQSFDKRELARTGRRHDAPVVERDVAMLRRAGLHNISIDLIAGLPGQTEASWAASVQAALDTGAPHLSVYMLEVDEDSRLGSEILLGGVRYGAMDVPSDDCVASMYEYAVAELGRRGLERYEISNFARPGFESLHNLKYWRRDPYVGFGADAHSFDGKRRWQNSESAREYVDGNRREFTEASAIEEKFFVGLRLSEGVIAEDGDWLRFGGAFRRFLSEGVMEQTGDRLRLTPRGVMVSNGNFPGVRRGMIDLRSDTVTKPTAAMRKAMFEAEVGDDVYGEDPTVNLLEQRAAEVTGKEAALFVPTGTMGNTIAIKLLTKHGQEVVCDSRAHLLDWELSMIAWFSGCVIRSVPSANGVLSWDQIAPFVRAPGPHSAPTGAIEIENTHNMGGGTVYPQAVIEEICERAHERGIPVHMDGARVFNAAEAAGISVREIVAAVDTVMFSLSKSLGAPAGSILAGPRKLMDEGRLLRKRLGGGMRQVGVLAAAGLIALEEGPKGLRADHANARLIVTRLQRMEKLSVFPVETNIVIFDVSATGRTPREISAALKERGVLMNGFNDRCMRAVTHYDVSAEGCAAAMDRLEEVLAAKAAISSR